MVFAIDKDGPAYSVFVIVPNDVGAVLRNFRSGDLCGKFVRSPVVRSAKDICESVFGGIVCIPNGLERRGRAVLASVKECSSSACIDRVSVSVLAVVFAIDDRSGIHVGVPAFGGRLRNHLSVEENDFGVSPGASQIKRTVKTVVRNREGRIVKDITPIARILRSGDVATVSRHHELGAFKEDVASTADKVHRPVNFAALPVCAAFFSVISVLAAQQTDVLVNELVPFILLQCHLAGRT